MHDFKINIEQKNGKLHLTFSEGLPPGTAIAILHTLHRLNLYTPSEIDALKLDYDVNF